MEDVPKSIAHQIGGVQNDALRFGLQGVKSDIVGSHPLQSAQESVITFSQLATLGGFHFCISNFKFESCWTQLQHLVISPFFIRAPFD